MCPCMTPRRRRGRAGCGGKLEDDAEVTESHTSLCAFSRPGPGGRARVRDPTRPRSAPWPPLRSASLGKREQKPETDAAETDAGVVPALRRVEQWAPPAIRRQTGRHSCMVMSY